MKRIPVAEPDLSGNEERYVVEALRSSWISSTGPFVQRFEKDFADKAGTAHALGVANGTLALHLALKTLDLQPGDEVLVPSLTYVATANAVRYCGAEPVFVDVDPDTWCIDPRRLAAMVTSRTKGILPVHLYGHPADMDAIAAVAGEYGLWVVEDAAEAHLARYKGRPVGGLGSMGAFSFYGNKLFTSGEGGAITCSDPELDRKARLLRGQGMDPERRYYFPIVGYNYRLTNLACAMLCAQLERADDIIRKRHALFERYRALLDGIPGLGYQPVAPWADPAPWLFCVTVDAEAYGRTRDELMEWLAQHHIETRPFFIPIHRLPPYERSDAGWDLPVTDRLGDEGVNLPTYTRMSDEDVARVADVVRNGAR